MQIEHETMVRIALCESDVRMLVRCLRGEGGDELKRFAEEFIQTLMANTPLSIDLA